MKNIIASVNQFALLPSGTIARNAGVFDMLTEVVPSCVRVKFVEANLNDDGAVEVYRKPGFQGNARAQK